ncbi:spore cortex-lytic enzyme [Mechercharimyces sp. CAU 1602]|uniref:spore cortex-lytic enzyme n=1 Tax=Mechercharimyces sp. CAU 1602 TaxID=2973933 RepID=UPI002163DF28|nr:spore cortex-lytic enzyme [Mechercharimyces sp. CAU 1602]MCS1350029.1 spore cortex-lytic enzyme [Mechercharimyces sp. CAU 1602]
MKFIYKLGLLAIGFAMLATLLIPLNAKANAPQTLQMHSQNGDVWDLQYRLNQMGYYTSELDGVFGYHTKRAVMQFQEDLDLAVDGIVGTQTWKSIKANSYSKAEVTHLARAVYAESRGEPYEGQVAVAAVILNRIESKDFPNSVAGIVFEEHAFESVSNGTFWDEPNATAYKAVDDALNGWDPSLEALFFYNPDTASSTWIRSREQTVKIGRHVFAE